MKERVLKVFGKYKKRPLDPEPKIESKQTNLKDFNISRLNNNTSKGVMEQLDVEHIAFGRGDVYDEGE
ncbi:MAG: hypothetical protein V3U72_03650 [Candidatus Aenigmarchaeota archaeon]